MYENYPSVHDRIKSTTIDSIILIGCMIVFADVLDGFQNVPDSIRILLFISLLMYEPICTAFGATFGNQKMNIRIKKRSDETKRINIFQAIIRFFFKFLLGWVSFLTIFISPKSRTIHDMISGSVMIKVKE